MNQLINVKNSNKWRCSYISFLFFFVLYFTLFQNIAFWRSTIFLLPVQNIQSILLLSSFFIFIFCALIIIFFLLCWQYTTKPFITIFLFLSAICNYFSMSYNIYIDKQMIANVFNSNYYEGLALVTPKFIIWMAFFWLLPCCIIGFIRIDYGTHLVKHILCKLFTMIAAIAILLAVSLPLYKQYASFFRNNSHIIKLITPSNYIRGTISYLKQVKNRNKPLILIGEDAEKIIPARLNQNKKSLLIFLVGETARAENFSLNNYKKNTNPLLSKQDDLISFQNVTACGTSTAYSVPCLFSNMPRKSYSANTAEHQENLLDVLVKANVDVLWLENNTGCQGVCNRLPSIILPKRNCPEGLCYDEQLLDNLDSYIKNLKNDTVLVMHMNGSHGPGYFQRYPKKYEVFTPSCNTNQIQDCTYEELINVYDNTILYTDAVLNQLIEILKSNQQQVATAMFYVSDHGESLGESGLYLHSAPYAIAPTQQTDIPMLFWGSDSFMKSRNIDKTCMINNATTVNYSHDNIFHSILRLMFINTKEYKQELDLFNSCIIN